MRFHALRVFTAFLFLLLTPLFVLPVGLKAAEEPNGSPPAAAEKEEPLVLPELVDLIPLATELSGRLAALEEEITAGVDLSAVEKEISGIEANLEDHSVQLQRFKASGDYRYGHLVHLGVALERETASLEEASRPVTEEIRQLGSWRKEWLAEKKRWKAWESSLLKDEPLDEVRLIFAEAQRTTNSALNLTKLQLRPLLAMQRKAGNVQAKINSFTAEVDALTMAKRGGVLYDSSPPMLTSKYVSQFGSGLLYAVQKGSGKVSWPGGRFISQQGWIVFLQGLLSLVLIIVIFRQRQELESSERWSFVGKRPFSAGFFLGFTILCFFYEGLPATWSFAQVAVICISFVRLVSGLIESSWKRHFVYTLIIFIIITQILYLVSLPLSLSRLYILVATLVGLFLSLRWAWASASRGESFLYAWGLRLASSMFVVVLILELWGRAGLAEYLLVTSMGTMATVLIALMLMYLARGGLEWVVHSPPFNASHFCALMPLQSFTGRQSSLM
jgi:hypothetical protein